jgi:hypothetical protein
MFNNADRWWVSWSKIASKRIKEYVLIAFPIYLMNVSELIANISWNVMMEHKAVYT